MGYALVPCRGLALAAFGLHGAYRGIRALYGVVQNLREQSQRRPDPIVERHTVDRIVVESFPASDPHRRAHASLHEEISD